MNPTADQYFEPFSAIEPIRKWEWMAVIGITLIGLVLRCWQIGSLPAGLWNDEAILGIGVLQIIHEPGWPIFFFYNGFPEEPMAYYMTALSVKLFGPHVWSFRLPFALLGTATIPLCWWVVRRLFNPRVALMAVLIFATMRWHIHFSRLGFRTLLSPFFCLLILGSFAELLHRRNWKWAIITGALVGASLYTYLSMRLFLGAVFAVYGWMVIGSVMKKIDLSPQKAIQLTAVSLISAVIIFAPLGIHFLKNPDHFSSRSGQISLKTDEGINWSLLGTNARDVALMGAFRGDDEIKHNLPGSPGFLQSYLLKTHSQDDTDEWKVLQELDLAEIGGADTDGSGHPVFDLITGLLFYLGILMTLSHLRNGQWVSLSLIAWLLFGAAASVLSVGAPNYLRTLLLSPLAAIFIAQGCAAVGQLIKKPVYQSIGFAAFFCWYAGGESYRYFGEWANHSSVYQAFNTDFTSAAQWIVEQPEHPTTILPAFLADHPSVKFLTHDDHQVIRDTEVQSLEEDRYWICVPHPAYPSLQLPNEINDWQQTEVVVFNHPAGYVWLRIIEVQRP